VRYQPPEEGTENGLTIRNDTGVYEGGEISIYYDPMIAKLCTHGPDRLAAINHMSVALDQFRIEGIRHNVQFLGAIMEHPRFRSGNITTGFIAEEYPGGFHGVEPNTERLVQLAAVAVAMNKLHQDRAVQITGQLAHRPRKLPEDWVVTVGDWSSRTMARAADAGLEVRFLNESGRVVGEHFVETEWKPGQPLFRGEVDGKKIIVQLERAKQGYAMRYRGCLLHTVARTPTAHRLAKLMQGKVVSDTGKVLLCPMPGLVKAITVEVGAEVKTGDPLAIVEAMKMENVLIAEKDAKVSAIKAKPGDSLAVDAVIMEFE
jgi:propionyl-CoA carboxylase alpha chain